mgnify:CR=1 FL=1
MRLLRFDKAWFTRCQMPDFSSVNVHERRSSFQNTDNCPYASLRGMTLTQTCGKSYRIELRRNTIRFHGCFLISRKTTFIASIFPLWFLMISILNTTTICEPFRLKAGTVSVRSELKPVIPCSTT